MKLIGSFKTNKKEYEAYHTFVQHIGTIDIAMLYLDENLVWENINNAFIIGKMRGDSIRMAALKSFGALMENITLANKLIQKH